MRLGAVLRRAGIRLAVLPPVKPADQPRLGGAVKRCADVGSVRGRAASFLAAMQIHISDHTLVPSLLDFLRERVHVIADQVGPNEVEVSLLGSMNGAKRRLELDLMLQLWRASHEHVETRILS